jgi:hypothetical protein
MKISMCASLVLAATVFPTWATGATLIASTSFEEVPGIAPGPTYTDTLGSTTNHALINNAGQPIVNWSSGVGQSDLDFSSSWLTNGDGSAGLTDGQAFGVYNFGTGNVPDGKNAFWMADTEGTGRLTFESVNLAGTVDPMVSIYLRVQSTGYELDDFVHAYVVQDDGLGNLTEATLLDTRGSDIDSLSIESSGSEYIQYNAALTAGTLATLVIDFDSDVAVENLRIDHVQFTAVPEPASLALFALGGLCLACRSTRRNAWL